MSHIIDRLRDDPQLLADARAIGREKAGALDQGLVVESSVFIADLTPIASGVALKELSSRLSGFFERFEGTGRGEALTE